MVVFDPDTATVLSDLPAVGSGLRWDEAVRSLAAAYDLRFPPEDVIDPPVDDLGLGDEMSQGAEPPEG